MSNDHFSSLWYVFGVHPDSGEPQYRLLGRFWLHSGNFTVLEDHGMAPGKDLATMPPEQASRLIRSMNNSQRRIVANGEDLRQGLYPDLLPHVDSPGLPSELKEALGKQLVDDPNPPRKSSFDYHRDGMPSAQHLEIEGDKGTLDGQPLAPEEMKKLMANLQAGKAKLRHRLSKSSESLLKIEPHLAEALGQVREAVKSGAVHPHALKTLNQTLFTDTMVPQIGNKMAYNDFRSRPRPGVHVHLDGNDFGSINKMHDHETGNQAIVAMGKALRQAMDESVGRKTGKLFRTGGDEFVAHVPSHEHAALFARALRSKMDAIPAIRGTHRLSMSLGFGPTPEHAEEALKDAKAQKKMAAAPLGQAKTHAASRMPGREGIIPVE